MSAARAAFRRLRWYSLCISYIGHAPQHSAPICMLQPSSPRASGGVEKRCLRVCLLLCMYPAVSSLPPAAVAVLVHARCLSVFVTGALGICASLSLGGAGHICCSVALFCKRSLRRCWLRCSAYLHLTGLCLPIKGTRLGPARWRPSTLRHARQILWLRCHPPPRQRLKQHS